MEWANPACQGSILHISSVNSSDWQFDHLTGGLQVSLMTPQWLLWLRALLASHAPSCNAQCLQPVCPITATPVQSHPRRHFNSWKKGSVATSPVGTRVGYFKRSLLEPNSSRTDAGIGG